MVIEKRFLNPLEAFVHDVPQVKEGGEIRIFGGDLLDFNNSGFITALEKAKTEYGALIRIITPPILIADKQGQNSLLKLRQRETIDELLHQSALGSVGYFHLIETDEEVSSYEEEYMLDLSVPLENRHGVSMTTLRQLGLAEFYSPHKRWFLFDEWLKALRRPKVRKAQDALALPFLITREGLSELLMGSSGDLRYLGPRQLLQLPGASNLLQTKATLQKLQH